MGWHQYTPSSHATTPESNKSVDRLAKLATSYGENMPPGHPQWHLPPANMRMVFEGKTPTELARQLKDPQQNGGKTLEQIIHHMAEDPLVATAWEPAEGRTKPSMTQAEAAKKMREWVDNGAAVPE